MSARSWLCLASVTLTFGTLSGAEVVAQSCPRNDRMIAPRLAEALPWTSDSSQYWTWSHGFERSNLGVGFLEPSGSDDGPPASDWLPRIRLPLFARPDQTDPNVWIADGFWIPTSDPSGRRPLTYRGMVETGYEVASLIVIEARDDGWILLHMDTGPLDVRGVSWGHIWTHTCFLQDGDVDLNLVLWEEWFATSSYGVTFRDGSRHALRAGPGTEHRRTLWVEGNDEIEFLEIRSDWARVRISRPGRYLTGCLGEDFAGSEFEGWIQWRDAEAGPWVWYPTRGC